ncbi:MAG: CAP domain-containing protein [Xanthobacteraceae bacterium]
MTGAALLGACAGDREPTGEPSFYRSLAGPDLEVDAAAAASMISGYRRNNGLSAVQVDPALMQIAQEQAQAMAARNKLGHDVNGNFKSRLARAGFASTLAVENVSAGYHTLAEAFSGWRDSAPHRANMLQNGVTRMGIAAVYSPTSKYKVFWTLVLAGPEERRG